MKKILSIFTAFVLCLMLTACGGEGGGAPFDYDSYQAKAKIKELANTQGFLVEYQYIVDEPGIYKQSYNDSYDDDWEDYDDYDDYNYNKSVSIVIAMNKDYTYLSSGNAEIYFDFSNEAKLVVITGYDNSGSGTMTYTKEEIMYSGVENRDYYEDYYVSLYTYLASYDMLKGSPITSQSYEYIYGRICEEYVIADEDATATVCIDQETGMCLKMTMTYSDEGYSYSTGLECVRFETNPTIILPNV